MILFFEGYDYHTRLLDDYFNSHADCYVNLPKQEGCSKIICVGYYYNEDKDEHIFILPKVFIYKNPNATDIKAFGEIALNRDEPIRVEKNKGKSNLLSDPWKEDILYQLPLWLYSAIKKYYHKKKETRILEEEELLAVTAGRKEDKNLSMLDIALAIINFYKNHSDFFVFCYKESHKGYNKINWEKTVRKEMPVIKSNSITYLTHLNKKKEVNFEEELMVLFHNTLRYIYNSFFYENPPETDYDLYSDREFLNMMKQGVVKRILRNIRENYYNETLLEMWDLLNKFHQEFHISGHGKAQDDYLLARNFDRVFEDMIDELLGDPVEEDFKKLKDNKTIDHLFLHQTLFNDDNNVYYIGDSKYYKPEKKPEGPARYKQFTYAKSIIQMAIDWYRKGPSVDYTSKKLKYIDEVTEGYNVTPNFFISGIVKPDYTFTKNVLQPVKVGNKFEEFHISQWNNRLFDRDTLFALMYDINFLFVLYSYVNKSAVNKKKFKEDAKHKFRGDFAEYLDSTYCFYELTLKKKKVNIITVEQAVRECYYDIKGKVFMPYADEDTLIMALDEANFKTDCDNTHLVIQDYFDETRIRYSDKIQGWGVPVCPPSMPSAAPQVK